MPLLTEGRRPALAGLQARADTHPGLWIDRYLPCQTVHQGAEPPGYNKEQAREARDALIQAIEQKQVAAGYREALQRWIGDFDAQAEAAATARAVSLGRVLVGAGQKGPAEFGITLHRTWGVPVLPGSSLKGIAAAAASRFFGDGDWARRDNAATVRADSQGRALPPNAYDALFGDVEEVGAVIFHDAWFVPGSDGKNGLHRDVLTVHHPDYYQREGAYTETEAPIPVPMVSAAGMFFVAVELHPALDPHTHGHWLRFAWSALQLGLRELGVGSKTNAGYGRVQLPDFAETSAGKAASARRAAEEARVQALAQAEADAARRAAEAEQRAELEAHRAGLPDAAARIAHTDGHEGLGRAPRQLVEWLVKEPDWAGIPRDAAHEAAAWARLDAPLREQVRRQVSEERAKALDDAIAAAKGAGDRRLPPALLSPAEKDVKKPKDREKWLDKLLGNLEHGGVHPEDAAAGIQALEAAGHKPARVQKLRDTYGL
jgi:CRISPR-associated protein Cmr6